MAQRGANRPSVEDPKLAKLKAERDRARRKAAAERLEAARLRRLNTELRRQLRELTGVAVTEAGEVGLGIGPAREC